MSSYYDPYYTQSMAYPSAYPAVTTPYPAVTTPYPNQYSAPGVLVNHDPYCRPKEEEWSGFDIFLGVLLGIVILIIIGALIAGSFNTGDRFGTNPSARSSPSS